MRPFRPAYVALLLFIFVGLASRLVPMTIAMAPPRRRRPFSCISPGPTTSRATLRPISPTWRRPSPSTDYRGERVLVFFSSSSDEARLFEITCEGHACQRVTLKEYTNPPFTTAEGIASILNDVKTFAPASEYAMTIGCHGMGWVPVNSTRARAVSTYKYHWESPNGPMTRFLEAHRLPIRLTSPPWPKASRGPACIWNTSSLTTATWPR